MSTHTRTRRKEATPEQKEAAKERRRQIGEMMKGIKAMTPEQRVILASRFGIRNAEGHELSIYNQCLLIAQSDKVSLVGGFSQWKKLGRSVKKGERALAIWVPCSRKAESGERAQSAIVPHGVDPSQLDESFFVIGNVFDITQTETEEEKAARELSETINRRALPTSESVEVEAVPVPDEPLALPESRDTCHDKADFFLAA